ncbi:MAG: hypothetical protein LBC61_03480 [Candidatus Peribacteria bacterium]|jgi:hypothetical protein|nr:hypothetical protein [Candidatus Peribacteria bacterium]
MLKDIDPSENSKFINEGCYNNNLYINSATGTTNEPNVTHNHEYQRY